MNESIKASTTEDRPVNPCHEFCKVMDNLNLSNWSNTRARLVQLAKLMTSKQREEKIKMHHSEIAKNTKFLSQLQTIGTFPAADFHLAPDTLNIIWTIRLIQTRFALEVLERVNCN